MIAISMHPITECDSALRAFHGYDKFTCQPLRFTCTCGRVWVHICDEAEGCFYTQEAEEVEEPLRASVAVVSPPRFVHVQDCKFRIAISGSVAIECDHGYDVCPICDPCTCPKEAT